jgi:hypothetical protein
VIRRRTGRNLAVPLATDEALSFTADLGVSSRRLLLADGLDPSKVPPRWGWHREHRLGPLVPGGQDRWWIVDLAMDEVTAARVVVDFRDGLVNFGLPFIERLADDRQLVDAWLAEEPYLTPPERRSLFILLHELGKE